MTPAIISVIVPVYNEETYLRECLDSILGQTMREIEVHCVDAGSTDSSLRILQEYAAADSRVSVHSGYGRIDAGTARNIGLSHAGGEFLSFLDSDDYFDHRMLEDAWRRAQADGSDIVVYRAQQLDMRTGRITPMPWSLNLKNCPRRTPFSPDKIASRLFNSFQNWTWNKLFRADLIRRNNIRFQSIQRTNDMAFTCEALALARSISVLPETYATYRIGTGTSLQQTNDASPTCFWDAYRETRDRLLRAGVYGRFERSFVNTVLSGTMYNLRSVRTDFAHREILFLIKHRADALCLTGHSKSYFYNKVDYRNFLRCRSGVRSQGSPIPDPIVTVVLPCLNSRPYIRECVESILEQQLTELELLIVDAGSTDGTAEVLEEYRELDPRVTLLHSDKKSYGYQINLGLQRARGRYFAIVESDDYIRPTMYRELCRIADAHSLEVLKADYCTFTGERGGRTYTTKVIVPAKDLYHTVLDPETEPRVFRNYVVSWCGIYSTGFLNSHAILHHESPGASFQDNGFWFQVFTQAHRVMFTDSVYYMLRRDNPGSSVHSSEKAFCMPDEYDFIRRYLSAHRELEEKYAGLCAYKRFKNCMWANDNLVTPVNREEFILRCSGEFREIRRSGEIEPSWYTEEELAQLQQLMDRPEELMTDSAARSEQSEQFIGPHTPEQYVKILQAENASLKQQLRRSNHSLGQKKGELQSVKNSVSFRVGRAITMLPRACRTFLRSWRNQGLRFALKRCGDVLRSGCLRTGEKIRKSVQCFREFGLLFTLQHGFRRIADRLRRGR